MKKLFSLGLKAICAVSLLATSFSAALADVILPGEKSVSICYKVTNVSDFADYKILVSPVGPGADNDAWYFESNSKCLDRLYKFAEDPTLYAINKSDFNENDLENISKIKNKMIPSGIELEMDVDRTVPESDPTDKIEFQYKIQRVDEDKLWIYKAKRITYYEDGSSDSKSYDAPKLPVIKKEENNDNNNIVVPEEGNSQPNNEITPEQEISTTEQNTQPGDSTSDTVEIADSTSTQGRTVNNPVSDLMNIAKTPTGIAVLMTMAAGFLGLLTVNIILVVRKLIKRRR